MNEPNKAPPPEFLRAVEAYQKAADSENDEQMEAAAWSAMQIAIEEGEKNSTPARPALLPCSARYSTIMSVMPSADRLLLSRSNSLRRPLPSLKLNESSRTNAPAHWSPGPNADWPMATSSAPKAISSPQGLT